MTTAHVLYIPTIFLLGFLTRSLLGPRLPDDHTKGEPSVITGKLVLAALVIFMAVFAGTHFFDLPRSSHAVAKALNGQQIFDKSPTFTSNGVYSRLDTFPEEGRVLYKQFTYTIDVLFPVSLFFFLILLARYVIGKTTLTGVYALAITTSPVLWLIMDFLENAAIFILLDMYPVRNELLAGSLGYITTIKFTLLLVSIGLPAVLLTFRRGTRTRSSV